MNTLSLASLKNNLAAADTMNNFWVYVEPRGRGMYRQVVKNVNVTWLQGRGSNCNFQRQRLCNVLESFPSNS